MPPQCLKRSFERNKRIESVSSSHISQYSFLLWKYYQLSQKPFFVCCFENNLGQWLQLWQYQFLQPKETISKISEPGHYRFDILKLSEIYHGSEVNFCTRLTPWWHEQYDWQLIKGTDKRMGILWHLRYAKEYKMTVNSVIRPILIMNVEFSL